jgi:hypothetical protein
MSNNFGQIQFGAGTAVLTPAAANGPALPTPLQLPILQDLSVDISADKAELYGQDQYPYGLARTKVKIDCKAKSGAVYTRLWSDLFFGSTVATGQTLFAIQESQTVTALACTATHGSTGFADRGLINATTGQPYSNVGAGSLTAVGQYKVSGVGAYTFFTADTIATALITYLYTSASVGDSATVTNKPMGAMPTFDFTYMNNQFGSNLLLDFYRGMMNKLSMPGKNTDFEMFEIDFSCFSTTSGSVFLMSMDE